MPVPDPTTVDYYSIATSILELSLFYKAKFGKVLILVVLVEFKWCNEVWLF